MVYVYTLMLLDWSYRIGGSHGTKVAFKNLQFQWQKKSLQFLVILYYHVCSREEILDPDTASRYVP